MGHIRDAERGVAFHGPIDHVDGVTAQQEVDKSAGGPSHPSTLFWRILYRDRGAHRGTGAGRGKITRLRGFLRARGRHPGAGECGTERCTELEKKLAELGIPKVSAER